MNRRPDAEIPENQDLHTDEPGRFHSLLQGTARTLLNISALRCGRGPHITRWTMYRRIAALSLRAEETDLVLSISGSRALCQAAGLGRGRTIEADYPNVDFLALPFHEKAFDYVVADQVLEHVEGNPQRAMDEARRVLRPGGVAILTTCFYNPLHWGPADYWRFSPEALCYLCRDYQEILQAGGWGNRWVGLLGWLGLRFEGVPETLWHPLNRLARADDPLRPIVTWVVARR